MLSAAPKPRSLRMSYRQWSRWDSDKARPASGTSRPYHLSPTCTFTTPVVKWVQLFIYSTHRQLILSWSHDVNTFSEHFLINSLGFSFSRERSRSGPREKDVKLIRLQIVSDWGEKPPLCASRQSFFATNKNLVYEGNNARWKGSSSFNFCSATPEWRRNSFSVNSAFFQDATISTQSPWRFLLSLTDEHGFARWINKCTLSRRDRGRLSNDMNVKNYAFIAD